MVWSLKTGRLLGTFVGAHTGSVLCLKFEKDWDLNPFDPSSNRNSIFADMDKDMQMDSDGYSMKKTGFMFTGSSDCAICVWNLSTGEFLDDDMEGMNTEMMVDRDRRVLAEPVAVLKGHTGGVLDLRIDDRWIVSW